MGSGSQVSEDHGLARLFIQLVQGVERVSSAVEETGRGVGDDTSAGATDCGDHAVPKLLGAGSSHPLLVAGAVQDPVRGHPRPP